MNKEMNWVQDANAVADAMETECATAESRKLFFSNGGVSRAQAQLALDGLRIRFQQFVRSA